MAKDGTRAAIHRLDLVQLLTLAPHCQVPPQDGADRRAWHLHEGLVAQGMSDQFLGRDLSASGEQPPRPPRSAVGGKAFRALAALATGQDYWQAKMLTPDFRAALHCLRIADYDAVLIHFLYSVPLLETWGGSKTRLLVETHNFDPELFAAYARASRNPLRKALCERAARTSLRSLRALPAGSTLVHVSEGDRDGYQKLRPDLRHVVIENGCRVSPRVTAPNYVAAGKKQLIFVGSLSAQMNQDSLGHFARTFWATLSGVANLRVIGSNPPSSVRRLCTEQGWELRGDVSEAELQQFYTEAHFAIAPFAYGGGSKLKLMEACGKGVPLLATHAGACGVSSPPAGLLVSDDPQVWLNTVTTSIPTASGTAETLAFAERYSWTNLAGKLAHVIHDTEITPLRKIET